ncbi:imidazole glycerol phosphate synthase subunit HisH [Ureibacillus manganicus]|uniref:Imidazole glycerol phosphate synthase subunit HisH n=1 Tax=Ureibacillus manganicus DSM 26584 TaxID=1384049 RepID=A0A0A3IB18_9BACL|nr:imidazole glycerol phosphate synthase subunit HisH [Ureibacillus manganicus]KGR80013.1 imidazole glycerol phosphate synthase [Ureibacillus manganicus DSM 26584]
MKIGVIDYGMGNLFSVEQALKRLNCEPVVSSNIELLNECDALILPGVGAFPDAMKRLAQTGLDKFIKQQTKPLIGICLGMQLLFEKSDEVELTTGLGIFKGHIKRFEGVPRIPHMGWNDLQFASTPDWLNEEIMPEDRHVYFVHSYYATEIAQNELVAFADYEGVKVPGIVKSNNFTGMQFHPEKSGAFGMYLLEQWLKGLEGTAC